MTNEKFCGNKDVYAEAARDLALQNSFLVKRSRLICCGISMLPTLCEGDEVLVEKTTAHKLRFGDIITYKKEGTLITHRFLFIDNLSGKGTFIIAKADNASDKDAPFPADSLLGRVIEIKRTNRRINLRTNQKRIAAFCTAFFSLLEWRLYQTILALKKIVLGNLKINKSAKQNLKRLIQKPKHLLFYLLFSEKKGGS